MKRCFPCIVCPNGCELEVETRDGAAVAVRGATCKRGEEYALRELTDPRRTIASSVRVLGGELPLASVRLDAPIPKKEILRVMDEIARVTLTAPVMIGDIAIADVLGLGVNVVATKNVAARDAL